MKFTYIPKKSIYNGKLLYIREEESLFYEPFSNNVGVSIMCGAYTGLDTICETGQIVHISGLNSKNAWIKKSLIMPLAATGDLYVNFDEPPIKGTGIDYDRTWETYYDYDINCICIGDYLTKESDDCVEFASGLIAVLRNQQLISIWAKISE